MTFEVAGALVGLLALPLLVFLHRRRRRVPPFDVPSLLFVADELESHPPRRRLLDVDLLLALLGAAALGLAAAGPRLALGEGSRTFRVVVSGGAPAAAFTAERGRALAALRGAVGGADRVEVVEVPAREDGPRPSSTTLLDVALAGEASWRGVVSDALAPPGLPAAVHWIRIGRKDVQNLGIVRASLIRRDGALAVFAMVQASASGTVPFQLVLDGERTRRVGRLQRVEGGGVVTAILPVGERWRRFHLALAVGDGSGEAWRDALAADDRVLFERRPLTVAFAPSLPPPYARALLDALEAALGVGGILVVEEGADLEVSADPQEAAAPSRAGRGLQLFPSADGDVAFAEEAPDVALEDGLVADLSTRGCDLLYAPAALARDTLGGATRVLLWRRGRTKSWPVVARRDRRILFLPDPLAGAASPAETPLWPLFVDNLRREVAGEVAGDEPGWRRRGLLDPASTDLGRDPAEVGDAARAVEGVAPAEAEGGTRLRMPLALLGLLALLLLWARRPVPSTSWRVTKAPSPEP